MRLSCRLLPLSFALSAWASAIPKDMKMYLKGRADVAVTESDLSNFELYAQYSAAAYCNSDVDTGTNITCSEDACPDVESAGAVVTATFAGDATDIQGFISTDSKNQVIVLSLRGSHSIRNWIADLVFVLSDCDDLTDDCGAHTGFYTAWKEIGDSVASALASAVAAYPSYSIVATGHSLGAAVSTIGTAYLRKDGYAIDLYTYGSPRPGNKALVAFVTDQAGGEHRVTHYDDPVPRLPPILVDYRHTSPEYWLSTGPAETINYTVSQIEVCEGYANTDCNAGESGFDTDAHGYYLDAIVSCSPDDTPFRARDISDEELAAKINTYTTMDIQYVAQNLTGDVWA